MPPSRSAPFHANGFYNPPRLTFGRRSFLIQPLSWSAHIWSTKEEWNPLSPPRSPPPEILVLSHSSPKAHSQKQWWGILSSLTPRELSQASEYIFPWIIKHLLWSLWQGCRRAVPLPCTSLCLEAAQPPFVNQFVKNTKGALNSWTYCFEECLYEKDNHRFLHPIKDEPNTSHHLFLTHSPPVLPPYLLN